MLSPKAELDVIVGQLSESPLAEASTHLSKRKARTLLARAVRSVCQVTGTDPDHHDPIKLFLLDLHTGHAGV